MKRNASTQSRRILNGGRHFAVFHISACLFAASLLAEPVVVQPLPSKDPSSYKDGLEKESVKRLGIAVETKAKAKNDRANSRQKKRVQDAVFNHKENSGHYVFKGEDTEIMTAWSCCGADSVYAYRSEGQRVGYKKGYNKLPDNPNRFEKMLDFSSRCYSVSVGETVVFKNSDNRFLAIKIIAVDHDGDKPFLKVRYRIY